MSDNTRSDIRRLLKTFGVKADETLTAYLEQNQNVDRLHVRVTLEDLTEYEGSPPAEPLHLQIDEEIRRQ